MAVKLFFASHFCITYFARRHVVDQKYGQTNAQSVRRWRLHTCAVHILVWCILVNCILVNCILVNCILVNCILVNCILGNCLLVNCILVNCTLVNCILVNCILVCWKQRQNKCSSVCGEVKARCYPSIGCCHTQGPAMCHQHAHYSQAQIQKYITHIQKYKVTHRGQPCVNVSSTQGTGTNTEIHNRWILMHCIYLCAAYLCTAYLCDAYLHSVYLRCQCLSIAQFCKVNLCSA